MPRKGQRKYTDEELLDNLYLVKKRNRGCLTEKRYENSPLHIASVFTITKQFGSWPAALKMIGCRQSKHYRRRYTKKKVLQHMLKIALELGRMPSLSEMREHPKYKINSSVIIRLFANYENCKEAFRKKYPNAPHSPRTAENVSDEELLYDVYQIMLSHPEEHIMNHILNYCNYSRTTYLKRFGTYDTICALVKNRFGISLTKTKHSIVWTRELLKEEYERIVTLIGRTPTIRDICAYSQYANIGKGINIVFGSYNKMLTDLEIPLLRLGRGKRTPAMIKNRQQFYIGRIQQIYRQMLKDGERVTISKIYARAILRIDKIKFYFGSIDAMFKLANIPKPEPYARLSESLMLQGLRDVTTALGKVPSMREYNKHPLHTANADQVKHHFKGFNNALLKAGLTPCRFKTSNTKGA